MTSNASLSAFSASSHPPTPPEHHGRAEPTTTSYLLSLLGSQTPAGRMGMTNSGTPVAPLVMGVSGHPGHSHAQRLLDPQQPGRFLHEIEVHRVLDPSVGFELAFEAQSIDEVLIVFDAQHAGAPACSLGGAGGETRELHLLPAFTRPGHFHALVGGDASWSRIRVRPAHGNPAKLLQLKFIARPRTAHAPATA